VQGVGPSAYGIGDKQGGGVRHVSVPQVVPSAYPGGAGFGGSATPEPETLVGLTVILMSLAAMLWRRRRAAA